MEILAIIPARSGSKGLPGKNTRLLTGHPLIAYSIEAAIRCKLISRVIVSTDCKEIARISELYGAEVPFIRPDELAQDDSTDIEVFSHCLKHLKTTENYIPDLVVHLRPTTPLRFLSDITNCIQKLSNHSEAHSLRIVTESHLTPYKMWKIADVNQAMTPLLNLNGIAEAYNQPRQKLPVTYWQVGTLDVIKTDTITEQKSMSGQFILPYIIDSKYAVDIDSLEDFLKAEQLISVNQDCIRFD